MKSALFTFTFIIVLTATSIAATAGSFIDAVTDSEGHAFAIFNKKGDRAEVKNIYLIYFDKKNTFQRSKEINPKYIGQKTLIFPLPDNITKRYRFNIVVLYENGAQHQVAPEPQFLR